MHLLSRAMILSGAIASATVAIPSDLRRNTLSAQERAAGWILLFNGRDLTGWRSFDGAPPAAAWQVRDDVLRLTKADGRMSGSDLVTAKTFGAFELQLDWKIDRGGNSGVLYLAHAVPEAPLLYQSGLEMQILDDAGHPDGRIATHRAGALYDMTVPPAGAARPAGHWNHARLVVERGRVRQWLNGVPAADVRYGDTTWRRRVAASKFRDMRFFGTFARGVIGLQDHGNPVEFANIKLRRLGGTALPPR